MDPTHAWCVKVSVMLSNQCCAVVWIQIHNVFEILHKLWSVLFQLCFSSDCTNVPFRCDIGGRGAGVTACCGTGNSKYCVSVSGCWDNRANSTSCGTRSRGLFRCAFVYDIITIALKADCRHYDCVVSLDKSLQAFVTMRKCMWWCDAFVFEMVFLAVILLYLKWWFVVDIFCLSDMLTIHVHSLHLQVVERAFCLITTNETMPGHTDVPRWYC